MMGTTEQRFQALADGKIVVRHFLDLELDIQYDGDAVVFHVQDLKRVNELIPYGGIVVIPPEFAERLFA